MKNKIIQRGIAALKEFGYPDVNEENILTDEVYSLFFKRMLEDTKDMLVDEGKDVSVIDELLNEIQ